MEADTGVAVKPHWKEVFQEAMGAPPHVFLELHLLPKKLRAVAFRRRTLEEARARER